MSYVCNFRSPSGVSHFNLTMNFNFNCNSVMQWASQHQLEGVTHIIWANQKTSQSQVLYVCET